SAATTSMRLARSVWSTDAKIADAAVGVAAIFLYTLAPELLIGWPRANRPEEREFLLPDVGGRPEVGRITGRGNTARSRARAQTRSHPGRRQREPDLHLARRPRAAADGHSLRAARRPFRRHSAELPHARHTDRAARAGRGPCAQRRRHDENDHTACGFDPA